MNTIELNEYKITYDESIIKITKDHTIYQAQLDNVNKDTILNLLKYYKQIDTINLTMSIDDSSAKLHIKNNDNIHNDNISICLTLVEESDESKIQALTTRVKNLENELTKNYQLNDLIYSNILIMIQELKNIDIPITEGFYLNMANIYDKISIIKAYNTEYKDDFYIQVGYYNNSTANSNISSWISQQNLNKIDVNKLKLEGFINTIPIYEVNPNIGKLILSDLGDDVKIDELFVKSIKQHKNLKVIKFTNLPIGFRHGHILSILHGWIPKHITIEYTAETTFVANQARYLVEQGYTVILV